MFVRCNDVTGGPFRFRMALSPERVERGTCARRRRICNGEHEMLTNSRSRRRVCLARNEYSGKAASPALRIAFAGLGFACPAPQTYVRRLHAQAKRPSSLPSSASTGPIRNTTSAFGSRAARARAARPRAPRPGHPDLGRAAARALRRRPIAVCLELRQGPIVSALLEHDFFVLFPVKPRRWPVPQRLHAQRRQGRSHRCRGRLGALDAPPRQAQRLAPESSAMRALRQLVETRRDLVHDRTRVTNRITDALKAYFPQVLEWFRDKETDGVRRLPRALAHAAGGAARSPRARSKTSFTPPTSGAPSAVERRLEAIRSERPCTTDRPSSSPPACSSRRCCRSCALCRPASSASTPRSPSCRPAARLPALRRLPGAGPASRSAPARRLRRATASASPAPPQSRSPPASRPSPSAAATSPGCTGATPAPSSSARPSSSGPPDHPSLLLGQSLLRCYRAKGARHQAALRALPSSGSASSTAAGSTAPPTTNPATSWRSRSARPAAQARRHQPPNSLAVRLRA